MLKPLMTMSKAWEIISMLFSYVLATNNSAVIFLQSTIWPSHQSMWTPYSLYYSNRSFPHGSLTASWAICPCYTCSMDIPAPSTPCSKPVSHVSKHKIHEEFLANDIDQLLHAIISVNPYLLPCSQITDKWKEVTKIIQAEGACIGHNHETLKNKVKSLLTWVQVCLIFIFILFVFIYFRLANNVWQGSTNNNLARSPMAHEAEKDPDFFASISRKLDVTEHLKVRHKMSRRLTELS